MKLEIQRSHLAPGVFWLAALSVLAGVVIGLTELPVAALVLALCAFVPLVAIEPIGGILILLLIAPLRALLATETALSLDLGQAGLAIVIIVWVLNRISQRRSLMLPLSRVQAPILIFTVATYLSLPGAYSPGQGLTEIFKWVEILLLISLCLALFGREEIGWLVFAVVLSGGLQAGIGLYEFFGGSGAEHLWILEERYFRAFGTFGQPNPFGAFMGITFPLAICSAAAYALYFWRDLLRSRRGNATTAQPAVRLCQVIFYLSMSALILAGLVASWSRGAWMAFAGSLLAMLLFVSRSFLRSMLLFAIVIVFITLMGVSGIIPDAITTRLSGFASELTTVTDVRGAVLTRSNYAVTERIAHWQAAEWMARDHLWLGVGFGNYEAAYPSYALMDWPDALGHAHNYYLNLLAEVGLVGMTAYLIAWAAIFALTFKVWRRTSGIDRAWAIGLIGVWVYIALHSLVDNLYVNNMFLHIGSILGALALLLHKVNSPVAT